MKILAHRGASFDAPENTQAAVELGFRQGADGVEFDIQLSSDGELVLMHDRTLERTTRDPRRVVDLTSAELDRLDAGSWKGPQWAGQKVPTLGKILDLVPAGKAVYIEAKTGPEIAEPLARLLSGRSSVAETWVISKHAETISEFHRLLPAVPVLQVMNLLKQEGPGTVSWAERVAGQAVASGCSGVGPSMKGGLNQTCCDIFHRSGLHVFSWTVDDPAEAKQALEIGVDALCSNRPGDIRKALHGAGSK